MALCPTFQKSYFRRICAAYGGIFVVMAIIRGLLIEKKGQTNMKLLVEWMLFL